MVITVSFSTPIKSCQTSLSADGSGSSPMWGWTDTRGHFIPGEELDAPPPWNPGTTEYKTPRIVSLTFAGVQIDGLKPHL